MIINKIEISKLSKIKGNHCVSIYSKTHRAGNVEEDKIRWKNACANAHQQLSKNGLEDKAIRKILRPALDLLERDDFWLRLSDTLCMFLTNSYHKLMILPIQFMNKVMVSNQFFLSPILLYFKNRQRFFLLDLSLKHIHFYECNKHHITPINIEDLIPKSIDNTLILANKPTNLQFRGHHQFHGHGAGKDDKDIHIEKFLRQVDNGLSNIFKGENVPLIIAGDISTVNAYKSISKYPNIVNRFILGNNQYTDVIDLHSKAYEIIKEEHIPNDEEVLSKYFSLRHTHLAISGIEAVAKALLENNLRKIFISKHTLEKGGNELLNLNLLLITAFNKNINIYLHNLSRLSIDESLVFGIKHY